MTDEELKRLLEANTERIEKRFDAIDKRFDAVDQRFDAVDRRFETVDGRFEALDKKVDDTATDLRRHFDVTIERLDRKFDLLAEAVALVDEKLDRKTSALEIRMEQGFAETQAMIRFSYAELDRRMKITEETLKTLEEKFANLQARIDRLETVTTTH